MATSRAFSHDLTSYSTHQSTRSASPVPELRYLQEVANTRKPLNITLPISGRIQGAPASPVRISERDDEWLPRPSSARIEHTQAVNQGYHSSEDQENHTLRKQIQHMRLAEKASGSQQSTSEFYDNHQDQFRQDLSIPQVQLPLHENDNLYAHAEVAVQHNDNSLDNNTTVEPLSYHHMNNRDLTPPATGEPRTTQSRPTSALSMASIARGRSSGGTAMRRMLGADMAQRPPSAYGLQGVKLDSSYPQAAPQHVSFNNADLRSAVGKNALLLSSQETFEMYLLNVKKTADLDAQYAFALLLIDFAREAGLPETSAARKDLAKNKAKDKVNQASSSPERTPRSGPELLKAAKDILRTLASSSYPFAQYYLADGYFTGFFSNGVPTHDRAFPLFVSAAKHGHAESSYRAALCYEFGWGARKDAAKAVQFYRQAASKNHPGAMTRLGVACMSGDLLNGERKYREGLKWLRRATDSADILYNAAPYHLALLYETGDGQDIFVDKAYAATLLTKAADLGHIEAAYRLGDAYEHARIGLPQDPALSVHFYTNGAQRGDARSMMGLCAWYMVGAGKVLEADMTEAYEWARRAAELGLTKAEYTVGFFTEGGIGCRRDPLEANKWYVRAAEGGEPKAIHRLNAIRAAVAGGDPMEVAKAKPQAMEVGKARDKALVRRVEKENVPTRKKTASNQRDDVPGDEENGFLAVADHDGAADVRRPSGARSPSGIGQSERARKEKEKECIVM